MSFLDKVKDAAGSAVSAVSDAAKDVGEKSREVTEKAKINREIKNEEKKIQSLYTTIGNKLFHESTAVPEGFEEQFAGIKTAMAEIERLKKSLESVPENLSCPGCGAKISATQPFCGQCGKNLSGDNDQSQPTECEVLETVPGEE